MFSKNIYEQKIGIYGYLLHIKNVKNKKDVDALLITP